jgi:hypothetical protein
MILDEWDVREILLEISGSILLYWYRQNQVLHLSSFFPFFS